MCIVVEYPQLEVVGACHEPVLARYEAHTANRHLCHFKCLDQGTSFVVIDVDCAVVETGQKPWFRRVEVYALDTI